MKRTIITLILATFTLSPIFAVAAPSQTAQTKARSGTVANAEIQAKIQELKTAREGQKEKIRTEVLEKAKERANLTIERAVKKYEATKAKINRMPVISDEKKAEISTKIDAEIVKINAYKTQVAAAGTVAEVKEVLQNLKTELRKSYNVVAEMVKAIHATHLQGIVTKLEGILTKLETKMINLGTAKTAEMTKLDTDAKTALGSAKAAILTNDFKEAKNQILAARKSMVQLAQKIKAATNTDAGKAEASQ